MDSVEVTKRLLEDAQCGRLNFEKMNPNGVQLLVNELSAPNYKAPPGFLTQIGRGKEDATVHVRFIDSRGLIRKRDIIDCQSMYSVNNVGFSNESVERIRQAQIEYIQTEFPPCARERNHPFFLEALVTMRMLTGLDCFLPKVGGAEVVESAVFAAKKFWHNSQKNKVLYGNVPYVIVIQNNFHGRTSGPRSFSTSDDSRMGFGPHLPNVISIPFNNIEALRSTIFNHQENVACILLEPIQGEGGVHVPDEGYLKNVEALCRRENILLIFDEIQTGMGRIGGKKAEELFAYQAYDVKPDLVCFGKAVGGGVPFTFVGGRRDVMQALEPGTDGSTFSGYPLGCISFVQTVKEIMENNLAVQSLHRGKFMKRCIEERLKFFIGNDGHPIKEVRGRGLFIGIEINSDFCSGEELSYALLEDGVRAKETGPMGQTLRFAPPLTISEDQIIKCVDALQAAIHKIQLDRNRYKDALKQQRNL